MRPLLVLTLLAFTASLVAAAPAASAEPCLGDIPDPCIADPACDGSRLAACIKEKMCDGPLACPHDPYCLHWHEGFCPGPL